jgi:uncharacterized protein YraI
MRQTIKTLLAALFVAGSAGAAAAVPATVETDLNIRSGPSTGYAVLDTMPGGAVIDVVACYQGWCEVLWDGLDGFANRAYLDIGPRVTLIPPPAGAIVAPGIVVYESRYYDRPIWSPRGSIIRQAIRREIRRDRRDARQERREDRRDVRQERREDRRDARQDRRRNQAERQRDRQREIRQERRREQAESSRERARDARRSRQGRADAQRDRQRRVEQSRQRAQQQRRAAERARAQERRQDARQNARQDRRQDRREQRKKRRERDE